MTKIDSSLKRRLEEAPKAKVRLIVRTRGDPGRYRPLLTEKGIRVKRELGLLKALAIESEASQALTLLRERWVLSVEEDREVRTL